MSQEGSIYDATSGGGSCTLSQRGLTTLEGGMGESRWVRDKNMDGWMGEWVGARVVGKRGSVGVVV